MHPQRHNATLRYTLRSPSHAEGLNLNPRRETTTIATFIRKAGSLLNKIRRAHWSFRLRRSGKPQNDQLFQHRGGGLEHLVEIEALAFRKLVSFDFGAGAVSAVWEAPPQLKLMFGSRIALFGGNLDLREYLA